MNNIIEKSDVINEDVENFISNENMEKMEVIYKLFYSLSREESIEDLCGGEFYFTDSDEVEEHFKNSFYVKDEDLRKIIKGKDFEIGNLLGISSDKEKTFSALITINKTCRDCIEERTEDVNCNCENLIQCEDCLKNEKPTTKDFKYCILIINMGLQRNVVENIKQDRGAVLSNKKLNFYNDDKTSMTIVDADLKIEKEKIKNKKTINKLSFDLPFYYDFSKGKWYVSNDLVDWKEITGE